MIKKLQGKKNNHTNAHTITNSYGLNKQWKSTMTTIYIAKWANKKDFEDGTVQVKHFTQFHWLR